jgi:hypothetical protein
MLKQNLKRLVSNKGSSVIGALVFGTIGLSFVIAAYTIHQTPMRVLNNQRDKQDTVETLNDRVIFLRAALLSKWGNGSAFLRSLGGSAVFNPQITIDPNTAPVFSATFPGVNNPETLGTQSSIVNVSYSIYLTTAHFDAGLGKIVQENLTFPSSHNLDEISTIRIVGTATKIGSTQLFVKEEIIAVP